MVVGGMQRLGMLGRPQKDFEVGCAGYVIIYETQR